jgi:predicted nucleic acid-binding Zn ribbon protein
MLQEDNRKTAKEVIFVIAILVAVMVPLISAADFEEILRPLQTIYDLVKYTATVLASLVMLFAGITYIVSGSDPKKRDNAKNMIMYVIIGLMVIWAAPFVVELILEG